MSDASAPGSMDGLQIPISTETLTAGAMLRLAREAAGLHVAALAVSMKIPVKKLEALESDRLDLLHDAVFVRALAGSVCRALKIDPIPILSKLPMNTAPKLKSDELGINAPFHSSGGIAGIVLPEVFKKPATFVFLALVLAGGIVFMLPDATLTDFSDNFATQANVAPDEASSSSLTPQPIPKSNTSLETVANAIDVAGTLPTEAATLVPSSTPVETVVVSSPAAVVASASQKLLNGSSPAGDVAIAASSSTNGATPLTTTGTVVFKAKNVTWVQVVDAKGFVQLSKTLAGGEVVGASGVMPLSVVIGRVDATDVEVRGQPFNLSGVSRDNVARFEVK